MGRKCLTFLKLIHHLPVAFFFGGGPLINIPSGPMFVRTVIWSKNLDLSKGVKSHPKSVLGGAGPISSGPMFVRIVIGPKNLDLSKGVKSHPKSVLGGGGPIPSWPTFVQAVNGPKILDLS